MSLAAENKKQNALPDNFLQLQQEFFMLRPIHNQTDYRKAVKVAERLAPRNDLTKTQAEYLESLVNNLEAYEKTRFESSKKDPVNTLKFLMDENGLNGSDLGRILGNRTLGYVILKRQRSLSKANIIKLAEHFSVSPALFL